MDTELSLCEVNLEFYFVMKDETKKDANAVLCFEKIVQRFESAEHCSWLSEEQCLEMAETNLSNRYVFVFSEFESPAFAKLHKQTKALIVGPRCVLSCFNNEFGVPNTNSPIFNVVLREKQISSSGLSDLEKDKVQKLVHYMGGIFERNELRGTTSYLITNTVMSQKYEKAVVHNIRTVTPEWIYHLWDKRNQLEDTYPEEYDTRFQIPIFYKIGITSTGISGMLKAQIKKLIETNGGLFYGAFKSELIHVLIATPDNTTTDKFRAAVKCKKYCLTADWIIDSAAKGYALPMHNYRMDVKQPKQLCVSTPTKTLPNESAFNADCTNISDIVGNMTVNETMQNHLSKACSTKSSAYKVLLANINVQMAKKAGSFLDGCNIFLCGFNGEENEKISKILSSSNATRFVEYDSRVEYIIIGQPNNTDLQLISGLQTCCNLVTLEWLVASIEQKQPADEREFLFKITTKPLKLTPENQSPSCASPASKKNIQSMNSSFRKPLVPRRLEMDETPAAQAREEEDLLQQYLVPQEQAPNKNPVDKAAKSIYSSGNDSVDNQELVSEISNYFSGLTFHVHGFTEECDEYLQNDIEAAGGKLVPETYDGIVDYLIVPTDIMKLELALRAKHTVNEHWIADAIYAQSCVDMEYFHKPFEWDDQIVPLSNLTVVLTIYSGSERKYLMHVGQIMGANVVDRYVKQMNPILVCSKPEGAKYNGAIKWKLPVVNCEWLLSCAKNRMKVPMKPFLMGESILPLDEQTKEASPESDSGPITSTAKYMSHAPVKMATDISPIVAKRSSEGEVDNQKRQRPDDFHEPDKTPILKHRRLAEIANSSRSNSPLQSQASPKYSAEDVVNYVMGDFPTPQRELICKELQHINDNETPETKRRIDAISTPDLLRNPLPEYWRTPARNERRKAIQNMHEIPPLPSPAPITPFAELQRRFWKKAVGDLYESPTQLNQMLYSMHSPPNADAEPSTSETQAAASSDAHAQVKRLSDFIQNTKGGDKTPIQHVNVPESMALQTQLNAEVNSESHEIVGWRDPTEFYESHQFRNRNTKQHVGTPIFNISCSDQQRLSRLVSQILQLKGKVVEHRSYDPSCTHVVCEKPSRSEKVFSSIAAGKWLLSLKYIEDSVEAGFFLNEEFYEWGNPKAAEYMPEVDETGRAAHRWRKELQARASKTSERVGAFSGFKVILHTHKKASFKNLLEAGAGVVLDVTEPYEKSKEALTATHCIVDVKNNLKPLDQKALKEAKVLCVNICYLQAYITADAIPNPDDFAAA